MLRLALNISTGLIVNGEVIARNVAEIFPYMATENILMAAVARGGDRQTVHECIRRHSHAVTAALKAGAGTNDLLDRLRADPLLAQVDFDAVLARGQFVGRSPQQVDEFIAGEIEPIRQRYGHLRDQTAEVAI